MRTRKEFTLLTQVKIPQTTEGGETWPEDNSNLTVRTTTPVQQVTQAHLQIGTDTGECKNAQPVDEKVTTQLTAELNRTMNSGAPGATEITTATTHADWLYADPAHPDTQATIIHTFPHAQEMTILYHQWNHILPPDPHPCLPAKEQKTLNYHKCYKQSYAKIMRKQN